MNRFFLLAFLVIPAIAAQSESSAAFDDAVTAFQRGDAASAEQLLNKILRTHPRDPAALGLLGAVLDEEKKYGDAEAAYKKALQLSPGSATLLNNFANHQLAMGDKSGARATYLKVIALDPARTNANLQLAQLAIEKKNGAEALQYMVHLGDADRSAPEVQILNLQALFLAGRNAEASAIMSRLLEASQHDARLSFSTGLALASVAQFGEAEKFFACALETAGGNFDVLYNLGLAAYHAGHLERAHSALASALAERPNDVDTLYNLAIVEIAQKEENAALQLLVNAARLDPARANVQLSLAQTASALGYYADALPAYEKYSGLKPDDLAAQREKAFMIALSRDPRAGLAALRTYVKDHPGDVTAHYEVGILENQTDPADAKAELNKALTLQPDFQPARFGRGVVTLLGGDAAAALPDLESSAAQYPENAQVLDRLGEAYLSLDRTQDAVSVLRKASALAPDNSRILMHLSRALTKAGLNDEAHAALERFRVIGPKSGNLIPLPGYVEFLSLSKEQQYSRYRQELEKRMNADPANPELKVRYLKLLVQQGSLDEARTFARNISVQDVPAPLAAEAGHALIAVEDYGLAKPFLEKAAGLKTPEVLSDLAIALSHTTPAHP